MLLRDDHVLLVAVTDGEASVLGYAWAQDYGSHLRSGKSVARLNDQFVAPTYRRSGTGTRLFVSVVRWVEERGVTWLQWQASSAALPFYERLGLAGDPCPDQGHPFFELDFAQADWKTQLRLG
jgi:GNAT superfamily N-acetyltransferase